MDIADKRAKYLKEVMEAKGFNNRSLALAVGSNPTLVREIINRDTKNPTSKTWDKLAKALGVPTNELLNAEPQAESNKIAEKVANLLSQLDPSVQEQLVPQLQGLVDAQRAEPE